jgi:WD40 repeat protein
MIVVTSQRNQYKIDLPEMKNKTAIQESDKFNVSLLTLKYPQSTSNIAQKLSPILIGQELKYIVGGDDSGVVTIWKDSEQLEHNCGTLLRGHASKIAAIKVTKHQDFLFTLGQDDHAIFEWKSRPISSQSTSLKKLHKKVCSQKNQKMDLLERIRRALLLT